MLRIQIQIYSDICTYFLVSLSLYDSKLNIFRLWTKTRHLRMSSRAQTSSISAVLHVSLHHPPVYFLLQLSICPALPPVWFLRVLAVETHGVSHPSAMLTGHKQNTQRLTSLSAILNTRRDLRANTPTVTGWYMEPEGWTVPPLSSAALLQLPLYLILRFCGGCRGKSPNIHTDTHCQVKVGINWVKGSVRLIYVDCSPLCAGANMWSMTAPSQTWDLQSWSHLGWWRGQFIFYLFHGTSGVRDVMLVRDMSAALRSCECDRPLQQLILD